MSENLVNLIKFQLETEDLKEIAQDADLARELGNEQHPALSIMRKAPVLKSYEVPFYDAYLELCSERPPSMASIAPIPFRAIIAYAQFWGYSKNETVELLKTIRIMDNTHLEIINKRISENSA